MLNGLRTATYVVDDLDRATAWFADVLGKEPYFEEPYYVGFNVGGYELGLMPLENADDSDDTRGDSGGMAYWGVDDIDAAVERLTDKGATIHEDVQDVGEGIRLATVRTPFGTLLGVIENPHFDVE